MFRLVVLSKTRPEELTIISIKKTSSCFFRADILTGYFGTPELEAPV